MSMGRIGQLKILVLVVGFIALPGAGPLSEALRKPMGRPLTVATNSEGEELADFLKDFEFIPGSAVLIDERYVLALYESPKRRLFARALFTADRDPEHSTLMEAVAFSLVDAQGEDVQMERVSNDNGERFTVVKNSRRLPLSVKSIRVDAPRSVVSHRYSDQIETDFAV